MNETKGWRIPSCDQFRTWRGSSVHVVEFITDQSVIALCGWRESLPIVRQEHYERGYPDAVTCDRCLAKEIKDPRETLTGA